MTEPEPFKSPNVTRKQDGSLRRVGFELEFSGITLEQAVDAVQSALGGTVKSETAAACELHVDELGDFHIELDWHYLKEKASADAEEKDQSEWIDQLSQVAALLVPLEVACPPIPMDNLQALRPMIAALRDAGAVGTEESLLAAYGVHINTEMPDLEPATLYAYLRAYSLLQWLLVAEHDIDMTRKASPYIDLYPDAYIKRLLARSEPTLDDLFDDYLEHNATRNRALDLLPLLAEIDEARVQNIVDDARIKPRPALHYRLPNCHIERPGWTLASSWNTWWQVEQLANRPDDLDELSRSYTDARRWIFGVNRIDWIEFLQQWLQDHALA